MGYNDEEHRCLLERAGMNTNFFRQVWSGEPRSVMRLLVHLPNFIKLYTRLFKDPRVSWLPKVILIAALLYAVIPFDAVFDWLVPLGWVDDIVVLVGAATMFIKLCPRRVVEEHVHLIDEGG